MKVCAYCDGPPPLTREHIWPNGFLQREEFSVKYSAKANKTFAGDLVIGDVCKRCNNVALSHLDAHACLLYDRRFSQKIEVGQTVPFTYDYGLFMRWLLKLSFNSARTTGRNVETLRRYRECILSEDLCSPIGTVALLATVYPSLMANADTGETKKIYPYPVARCAPAVMNGINLGDVADIRVIMINAYCFTLVVSRSPGTIDARLIEKLARTRGQPLDPGGRMRVGPPIIAAHEALAGISAWPGLQNK